MYEYHNAKTTKVAVKSISRAAKFTPSVLLTLFLNRVIANYLIFVFHSI